MVEDDVSFWLCQYENEEAEDRREEKGEEAFWQNRSLFVVVFL